MGEEDADPLGRFKPRDLTKEFDELKNEVEYIKKKLKERGITI